MTIKFFVLVRRFIDWVGQVFYECIDLKLWRKHAWAFVRAGVALCPGSGFYGLYEYIDVADCACVEGQGASLAGGRRSDGI